VFVAVVKNLNVVVVLVVVDMGNIHDNRLTSLRVVIENTLFELIDTFKTSHA